MSEDPPVVEVYRAVVTTEDGRTFGLPAGGYPHEQVTTRRSHVERSIHIDQLGRPPEELARRRYGIEVFTITRVEEVESPGRLRV